MAVNATEVLYLTSGLFKAVPSKAILTDLVKFNGNIDQLAATLGTSEFAINAFPFSDAEKAKTLAENLLGSTVADKAAAVTALEGILNANGGNVGIAAAAGIRAILTDAAFADAKAQLENRVKVAQAYVDSNKGNEISTSVLDAVTNDAATVTTAIESLTGTTGGNEAGVSRVLTTGQDVFTGTSGNDNFRAVAGVQQGSQDQTTLNSADNIDGATGNDTLIVNMTGNNYAGGARIKNIETLQIGTNLTNGAVTFDYNINQGQNEITEVTKVVYDQINQGENLRVVNLLKTGDNIPTLAWTNEANSIAGTIQADFRQSAIEGSSTALTVELNNVLANVNTAATGVLNIGAGVETLNLVSGGTSGRNTLNTSGRNDGRQVDIVSAGSSTTATEGGNDDGSLKKVVITGTQEVGKAAQVIVDNSDPSWGLTDRAVGGDLGVSDTDTGLAGQQIGATSSNLLSVAATVTEVDASAAEAAVNVRFTNRVDGNATNVTFKGGKGNDYVEFEVGAVNATGGAGNDTFAFIANALNSTITADDTIVGGEGTDTIQVGVNGLRTYSLTTTEFENKSGIDVLDLRGNINTVRVSDAFVAASDAGLTIRTDKIVQSSDTSTANPSNNRGNVAEDNTVNTIDLTALSASRKIDFIGGSGSDRIIVNEASLNSNTNVDGGTNVGNDLGATGAGDYDTITVVDNAVLSRGDLANVKNVEGIILTKSDGTSSRQFTVELTESFILNNTSATGAFVITTANAANANTLAAAQNDRVNIDVTDLFSNNQLKNTLVNRGIDVQGLNALGNNVTFTYNNQTNLTLAQLQLAVDGAGSTFLGRGTLAADATIRTNVTQSAAIINGNIAPVAGLNLTAAAANVATATITGGAGVDTLTLTDAGGAAPIAFGANVTAVENLVLANGTNNFTFNAANAFTSITGGTGADTLNVANLGTALTISLGDAIDTLTLAGSTYTGSFNGGNGVDVLTLVTGSNISGATITSFETLNAAGANTMTVEQYNAFNTVNSAGAAADTLTLSNAGSITAAVNTGAAAAGFEAIVLANGTNNLTLTGATTADIADATITGGTGTDTLTFGDLGGVDQLSNKTNIENVVFTAAQTGAVTMQAVAGWTVTDQAGGGNGYVLSAVGAAGQNFVASNAAGSVVTGSAGVDTFNFTAGTGADALTLTAGVTNIDTITGFNFNADTIATGNAGVAVTALNIATADTGTLVAAMQTAINGALASFDDAGDVVVFTVAAGTAAGTYLAIAGNADATAVLEGTNDFIVKLVAYTGTIDNADFVV